MADDLELEMKAPLPLARLKDARRFDLAAAAHLFGRVGYGADLPGLRRAVKDGLEATVDRLLEGETESETFKETDGLLKSVALEAESIDGLKGWWAFRLADSRHPLAERMTLFWHDHFATSYQKVRSVRMMADQNDLFRREALGRFDRLLGGVARDPAMLVFLDGNLNRKRQPNENFARELFELFSLGLGQYGEADIQESARAFSGWHVRHGKFWFNTVQHDVATKRVFGKSGPLGGQDVLDLTLQQPACPKFLAGKLLEEFVGPVASVRSIEAVAGSLRRHRWELRPVLGELFRSELFFSSDVRGNRVKSPVELMLGTFRCLGGRAAYTPLVELMAALGQELFSPPSVKGWDGGRGWLNTATMILRLNFAATVSGSRQLGRLGAAAAVERPVGPLVDELLAVLVRQPVQKKLRDSIVKQAGTGATPDRVRRKAWHLVVSLPEYQLG